MWAFGRIALDGLEQRRLIHAHRVSAIEGGLARGIEIPLAHGGGLTLDAVAVDAGRIILATTIADASWSTSSSVSGSLPAPSAGSYQLGSDMLFYRTDSLTELAEGDLESYPPLRLLPAIWTLLTSLRQAYGLRDVPIEVQEVGPIFVGGTEMRLDFYLLLDRGARLVAPRAAATLAAMETDPPLIRIASADEHPGLPRFWDIVGDPTGDRCVDHDNLLLFGTYLEQLQQDGA